MGAWEITRKDLRLLARDRRAFAVLLAFPLALIAMLGPSAGRMLAQRENASPPSRDVASPNAPADEASHDESAKAGQAPQTSESAEAVRQDAVYRTLVPAYTVFFAFFLINIMARSFISERELGTLRRLQLAPISPGELLIGKTLPFWMLSLLQSSVLFLAGHFVFGMPWGRQPWLLLPVFGCVACAATSLGLLVATLVRTDAQISAYANLLVILTAGISGCFMPRDWLPPILLQVSLITPHAWALIAFEEILAGAPPRLMTVFECCVALLGFALAFFLWGRRQFSGTLDERR